VALAWTTTADVDRYDEALEAHLKRVRMTAEEARALDDGMKGDAFWVSGGLQLEAVQRVFDKLTVALERGDSFEEFRKAVLGELRDPAYAELVFRNATQRAYNAGRYAQMTEPETLRFRPYWLYDAILDGRTTVICRECNGTLLPADDPWWNGRIPPLHHSCRSSLRNLRRSEGEKRGVTKEPPALLPPPGWGALPTKPFAWRPDPKKYEPGLVAELNKKAAANENQRASRPPAEHTAEHWEPTYRERYGDAAKSLAHGKAALERGLDMTVEDVHAQLNKLPYMLGTEALRGALKGADGKRTLRAQAGEVDPLRKAAAAVAGHLQTLPKRPKVTHRQLVKMGGGKRALDLMSAITGPKVKHAGEDWRFGRLRRGGYTHAPTKEVKYDSAEGTLEHELCHVIEELNPELFSRAIAFLHARARGEKLEYHGKMAGQDVYAWDDQFLHWYTGRKYGAYDEPFGTEITSTAMELLVAGRLENGKLSELVNKDPEHFLFLLGQLAGP